MLRVGFECSAAPARQRGCEDFADRAGACGVGVEQEHAIARAQFPQEGVVIQGEHGRTRLVAFDLRDPDEGVIAFAIELDHARHSGHARERRDAQRIPIGLQQLTLEQDLALAHDRCTVERRAGRHRCSRGWGFDQVRELGNLCAG